MLSCVSKYETLKILILLKKYPVLFCNYGGPGKSAAPNGWGSINIWHHYLTQQGYIIVCVDNTGTGFRGEAFKKKTYLTIG